MIVVPALSSMTDRVVSSFALLLIGTSCAIVYSMAQKVPLGLLLDVGLLI